MLFVAEIRLILIRFSETGHGAVNIQQRDQNVLRNAKMVKKLILAFFVIEKRWATDRLELTQTNGQGTDLIIKLKNNWAFEEQFSGILASRKDDKYVSFSL